MLVRHIQKKVGKSYAKKKQTVPGVLADQEHLDELEVDVRNDDNLHIDDAEAGDRVVMGNHKTLFDDNKLKQVVDTVYLYISLGLRVDDLSYQELMSRKINYGRQLFIFQQVHHVFQSYKDDLYRRFVTTSNASWAASLVYDMLDNGVGNLCMKPYQDIILKGRAQNFLNTFPRTMNLMAHYKRDKVARSYVFFYLYLSIMGHFGHLLE